MFRTLCVVSIVALSACQVDGVSQGGSTAPQDVAAADPASMNPKSEASQRTLKSARSGRCIFPDPPTDAFMAQSIMMGNSRRISARQSNQGRELNDPRYLAALTLIDQEYWGMDNRTIANYAACFRPFMRVPTAES